MITIATMLLAGALHGPVIDSGQVGWGRKSGNGYDLLLPKHKRTKVPKMPRLKGLVLP